MQKPKRICSHPGCSNLTQSARCEYHEAIKHKQRERTHYHAWYSSRRWRILRTKWLSLHPFCVRCIVNGNVVIATIADHIRPHKGDTKLFYDTDNLQSLCKRCHDIKTAKEDGGFGNK